MQLLTHKIMSEVDILLGTKHYFHLPDMETEEQGR
jgi:hypothetical protein